MGLGLLAVLVPLLSSLSTSRSELTDKTIVAYDKGRLDWLKPKHGSYGQQSAGLYGMMPTLVSSLGGEFVISEDLSREDLAAADVLILIHPDRPWSEGQLERIWDYVRGGGALLLVANPTIHQRGRTGTFNEVLEPTGLHVRFDTAIPCVGNWEQSFQTVAHPAIAAGGDRRNRFGLQASASIRTRWPARPVLVGRWGWSDPGSDALLTREVRFDAGEKLGDLVLAAEQPLGSGTSVVLGDASSLTNETIAGSYMFFGRLLGYLASGAEGPRAWWRQTLGLLACLAVVGLMGWRGRPGDLAAVAVLTGITLAVSTAASRDVSRVLPDGRREDSPSNVAYIGASHLESYSDEGWPPEGISGLVLTLMRNGYLPLMMPELTQDRLERARLLISIAPARAFSEAERKAVVDFVRSGGLFICTVGADRADPVRPLLEDFDLEIPRSPVRPIAEGLDPWPMGRIPAAYLAGKDNLHVWFYAGWPISCWADQYEKRAVGGDHKEPVILARPFEKGKVVLIGDTEFALNKDLEVMSGQPFYGRYENADFWRWLLSALGATSEEEIWIPPDVSPPKEPASATPKNGSASEGPLSKEVAP